MDSSPAQQQQQQQQQQQPSSSSSSGAGKSHRPPNTAFRQQRLKAWQPILTPKTVLPTFFLVGLLFLPLGIVLFLTSHRVVEVELLYTDCDLLVPNTTVNNPNNPTPPSPIQAWSYNAVTHECTMTFHVDTTIPAPYYVYYGLTRYYQNHRRYVKSLSSKQLRGEPVAADDLHDDCDPYATLSLTTTTTTDDGSDVASSSASATASSSSASTGSNANNNEETRPIYPCGLIANSLFNDTFYNLTCLHTQQNEEIPISLDETGIAWPNDQEKFKKTSYTADSVYPPPNWADYQGKYSDDENDPFSIYKVYQNEHFQVWMRTAGLPDFRKLYAHSFDNATDLAAGDYRITVKTQYPVREFGGTKSIVISSISWLGGRNDFLGIAYLTVGSVCLALAVIFLVRHILKPRKLGDHSYLSWSKQN